MKTFSTLALVISFGILSCINNKTDTNVKDDIKTGDHPSIYSTLKTQQQTTFVISDNIKKFDVDDYPVSNAMLVNKINNYPSHKKQSGQTYSYDKIWFTNDTIKQTLVFDLYTDGHLMLTYHFYSNDIPTDLINKMELYIDGGERASEKQKLKDFDGFLNQTTKITSTYFITKKGFRLGDTKQKAIDTYGNPDKISISNGIEKLEWDFIGDLLYDEQTDLKGKPIANDSFGHKIVMYFKNGKLFGQILYNDIP